MRTGKKIVFALAPIFLCWLLLEAICAFLYPRMVRPEARNLVDHLRHPSQTLGLFKFGFIPHPYTLYSPAPGLEQFGYRQHNSLGFRGPEIAQPKPPGVVRILCLGGSTTYSTYVYDPEKAYPRQLEAILRARLGSDRVEVVNGGMTYATSAELLGTLAFRGFPLDLDMVILNEGGNDIEPFLAPGYKPDYSHWRRSWALPEPSAAKTILLASPAARLVYGLNVQRRPLNEPFQICPSTTGWDGRNGALEFARDHDPVGFRNNTESMILMAKGRGIDFALVNFAFAPQYDIRKFPAAEIAYKKHLQIFADLAAKHDLPLVHFERNTIPPEHWADHPAWCHLDEAGDRMKAEIIAGEILPLVRRRLDQSARAAIPLEKP